MREYPEHEPSAELLQARQVFEQYGATVRNMKIATGIGTVNGALAGSKLGIPGAIVGAALGALSGYWKSKAVRTRIYAQLDAMGLLAKPSIRLRNVTYLHNAKFTFQRYPYGEQTALVIIPILQKHYPHITDERLTELGQGAQVALMKFRREHPDIPIALAIEVILLLYGIARNALGEYDLITPPSPGQDYHPAPLPSPVHTPPPTPPPSVPNYWLYAGVIVGGVLLLRA